MKKFFYNNGLSVVLLSIFLLLEIGLSMIGLKDYNNEQIEHGQRSITYLEYVESGSFLEATMENWESEFLQMFAYVILTVFLYQKGSAESKKIGEPDKVERDPKLSKSKADAPMPVRRGGLILQIYKHSLSLAFLILFLFSFLGHAYGGLKAFNEEEIVHGNAPITFLGYLSSARFWFESIQNWQSEFLSIGLMVVFTIFLRQWGSPESKPVDSPNSETGH